MPSKYNWVWDLDWFNFVSFHDRFYIENFKTFTLKSIFLFTLHWKLSRCLFCMLHFTQSIVTITQINKISLAVCKASCFIFHSKLKLGHLSNSFISMISYEVYKNTQKIANSKNNHLKISTALNSWWTKAKKKNLSSHPVGFKREQTENIFVISLTQRPSIEQFRLSSPRWTNQIRIFISYLEFWTLVVT